MVLKEKCLYDKEKYLTTSVAKKEQREDITKTISSKIF